MKARARPSQGARRWGVWAVGGVTVQGLVFDHRAEWPMAAYVGGRPERLRIVARTSRGSAREVGVWFAERYRGWPHLPPGPEAGEAHTLCTFAGQDGQWDYWEADLSVSTGRYKYLFWIVPSERGPVGMDGLTAAPLPGPRRTGLVWAGDRGLADHADELWPFEVPHRLAMEMPAVPHWARGAVFYQVFVDRFYNGDPGNDPPGTLGWPAPGEARGTTVPQGPYRFYGGDLAGVTQKLPYLASLCVDAVYLTPIFRSPSSHKYDTEDYLAVDPAFGNAETLRDLVARAHELGIRVVLDLVLNHSGDRFFAFRDVVEKGERSAYREWFFVQRYPVAAAPPSYETFATGVATMPKLNTAHPEVRRYLVDVALHWMRHARVDGFRLDVANEVSPLLWRDLRAAVRAENPEAFLIGEIFHGATPWLRGDQWDSVMNYPWRQAVVEFFAAGRSAPSQMWERLETLRFATAPPVTEAMVNLIGSHDVPRFLRLASGDVWRLELATLFQFAYPGIAQIYYGDEAAMDGGDDPDCRRPMEWLPGPDGRRVLELVRGLGQWRRSYACLKTGALRLAVLDDAAQVLAFWREAPEQSCLAVVNRGRFPYELSLGSLLPGGHRVVATLTTGGGTGGSTGSGSGDSVRGGGRVVVAPRTGMLLAVTPGSA